jgi:hypothetical protein
MLSLTVGDQPPIHRLPNEVLSIIFVLRIKSLYSGEDPDEEQDMLSQFYDKSGPHALVQTCSRWRNIAFDLPRLWNQIFISVDNFRDKDSRSRRVLPIDIDIAFRVFNRRVAYSRNVPLEIDVHLVSLNSYTSAALLDVIFEVSPRCSYIGMFIDQDFPIAPFLTLQKGHRFPHLRRIELDFEDLLGSHSLRLQDFFSNAPLLGSVVWRRWVSPIIRTLNGGLSDFRLPWTQLTTVEFVLRDCDLPVLLQSCPNLKKVVYFSYNDEDPWSNPSPFTHDKLEYLDIRLGLSPWRTPRLALETFFRNVELPRLESLRIEGPSKDLPRGRDPVDNTLAYSLAMFLQNSHPWNLRVIILESFYLHKDFLTLMERLSFTPDLKQLEISFRGSQDNIPNRQELSKRFISLFTVSEVVDKPFLPKLQTFCLDFRHMEDFADEVEDIVAMVRSRRDTRLETSGVGPLKKFQFGKWLDEVDELRELAVEGQFEVSC